MEVLMEQEEWVRAAFAEACFLLMRERRYGIGGCGECEDVEVLQARLEEIEWLRLGSI
jgi:hypothetical protein